MTRDKSRWKSFTFKECEMRSLVFDFKVLRDQTSKVEILSNYLRIFLSFGNSRSSWDNFSFLTHYFITLEYGSRSSDFDWYSEFRFVWGILGKIFQFLGFNKIQDYTWKLALEVVLEAGVEDALEDVWNYKWNDFWYWDSDRRGGSC